MGMRPLLVVITLACWLALFPSQTPGQPAPEPPPPRVGQVIITGNHVTKDWVIRQVVGLYPGQVFRFPELRLAERNLARLGIFRVDPEKGIRPTVSVMEGGSEFKDIVVQVQEESTGGVLLRPGFSADGQPTVNLVLEERNFDPWGFPACMEDVRAGRAFRGGGWHVRLEVFQLPVFPCRLPGLGVLDRLVPPSAGWRVWDAGG
jgi:hypothetical protein